MKFWSEKFFKHLVTFFVIFHECFCQIDDIFIYNGRKVKCGQANYRKKTRRITNGTEVTSYKYPWMAAMYIKGFTLFHCGGSIITEKNILTAGN